MMEARRIYGVVLDNLTKPAKSDPKKSIGEVLTDGTYNHADLIVIYNTTNFPPNNRNHLNAPEGAYTSSEAMHTFACIIEPYLSDKELFHLTHELTRIEVLSDTQAFRNATLVKPFMCAELERHAARTPQGELPAAFLIHFKEYVLPLCQQHWPKKLEENINRFASFNLSEAGTQFREISCYQKIIALDTATFNPELLSVSTLKNKAEFTAELASLRSAYKGKLAPQPFSTAALPNSPCSAAIEMRDEDDIGISCPSGFAEREPTDRELVILRENLVIWKNKREKLSTEREHLADIYVLQVNADNMIAARQTKQSICLIESRMRKLDKAIEPAEKKLPQETTSLTTSLLKMWNSL
jgi:hypothetical protein